MRVITADEITKAMKMNNAGEYVKAKESLIMYKKVLEE